jgi:glycosyltransferase involved in cell wall biosynthesis
MSVPIISVIIPTCNRVAYLKKAIDSVYAQTLQQFEIIVVDDGSTDETAAAVKPYDVRLRYFHQPHLGVSAARNHALREASSNYIAFLDDDDLFAPTKLEEFIGYFTAHPDLIFLCSGFSFIDAKGEALARPPFIPEKTEIALHDIALFTLIHTHAVMARRDAILAVGGFGELATLSEDYQLWAKLLIQGKGGAIQKPLSFFRVHAGNTPLPFWKLYRANSSIIEAILASGRPNLENKAFYIANLRHIIADHLRYQRKYFQLLAFILWAKITP